MPASEAARYREYWKSVLNKPINGYFVDEMMPEEALRYRHYWDDVGPSSTLQQRAAALRASYEQQGKIKPGARNIALADSFIDGQWDSSHGMSGKSSPLGSAPSAGNPPSFRTANCPQVSEEY